MPDHVQSGADIAHQLVGNGAFICVMTTIVDPLDDLDSSSLLAVCNL